MSWARTVRDWNRSADKVIVDAGDVYALPLKGTAEYNVVKELYERKREKGKKKEIEVEEKREVLKPAAAKVQKFIDDMSKEEAESIVKSGGFRKLTDDMFDDMEKPKISKDTYNLFHYAGDVISGLFADVFKGKEKKEYLKKVFDKLYPGNKGLTSNAYSILTDDLGEGNVGIKIFQKDNGKVDIQFDYDIDEANTDKSIFRNISLDVYGDRIEEERKKYMDEEERQLQERNKKFDDELKAEELVKRREKALEGLKKVADEASERNKQRKREAAERAMMAGEDVKPISEKKSKVTLTRDEAADLFENKYVEGYEFKDRKDMAIAVRALRIALPELTSSVDALAKFFMKRGFKGREYEIAFRKGAARPGKTFVQDALNNRV